MIESFIETRWGEEGSSLHGICRCYLTLIVALVIAASIGITRSCGVELESLVELVAVYLLSISCVVISMVQLLSLVGILAQISLIR